MRLAQDEGVEVEGTQGYKYFGAAKKLKGVKELLQRQEEGNYFTFFVLKFDLFIFPPFIDEKTKQYIDRSEMYKNIDADYYGYRDDDEKLKDLENKAGNKARELAIKEWKEQHANSSEMDDSSSDGDESFNDISSAVPTKLEMQEILLEKQKEEILKNYLTPALQRAILSEKQNKSK